MYSRKSVGPRMEQKEITQFSTTDQPNSQEEKVDSFLLPLAGSKGTTIVKNVNKTLENVLPSNVKNTHYIHRSRIK